jgi:SET domain-containing protein
MPKGLTIKQGRHGRGVFATRRFAKGDLVETCPTVEVPDSDVTGFLRDYVFTSVKERDIVLALGYGMLYNHSADPNLEYVQEEPTAISFFAIKAVQPGDELTIDYGEEWWETRGIEPD